MHLNFERDGGETMLRPKTTLQDRAELEKGVLNLFIKKYDLQDPRILIRSVKVDNLLNQLREEEKKNKKEEI